MSWEQNPNEFVFLSYIMFDLGLVWLIFVNMVPI